MIPEPEATVTAAFAAFERGAWRELADLMGAQSLAMFRDMHLSMAVMLEQKPFEGGDSVGGSLAAIQTGPEWLTLHGNTRIRALPGAPKLSDLAALSPTEFFIAWQEASRRPPVSLLLLAWIGRLFRRRAGAMERVPVVIGSVAESDDLVHVLYRQDGYSPPERVDLVSVTRSNGQWRVDFDIYSGWNRFTESDSFLVWRRVFWKGMWFASLSWLKRKLKKRP
jgi:hypothetical protein